LTRKAGRPCTLVNLALVGALFMQTSGVVWWASAMHSTLQTEVATNERQDAVLDALKADVQVKADRFYEVQRTYSEQLIEQRADLRAIRELTQRIEVRLDKMQTNRR
jgi:hypothetical protein